MELMGLVFIWPLLILVIGFAFVSVSSVWSGFMVVPVVLFLVVFVFGLRNKFGPALADTTNEREELDRTRRGVVAFSIALFLPIFVKYLLSVAGGDLPAMILSLVFGFGILIWGMFIKNNRVLAYANVVGGAFVVVYLYFQIWSLGQLAQVIATAFGLVVAVLISIIKFRDKLV